MNIEQNLEISLTLAKETYDNGNYPIGAILIVDENILLKGQNKVVTQNNPIFHAEIDIINKGQIYKGKENKKILFVTLEPCNNCAKALVDFGVDEVYYILEDPSWGGKDILNLAGIKTSQVKFKYEEYLDLIIEFMQKHKGYDEALLQYISIKKDGKNSYKEEIDKFIKNNFQNISSTPPDYYARKIVYNNTTHYLKKALLTAPQEYHQIIINGYVSDANRIIQFIYENIIQKDFDKLEISFIKQLHKIIFPEGFVLKNKDINGNEYIQMIPGEYRTVNTKSSTNPNEKLYHDASLVEKGLEKIVGVLNNSDFSEKEILLFLSDFFIVHPFGDGNGKVVYILTDLLLLKKGFSPYYFGGLKEKDEIGFYKVLDKVYETRDTKYFYEFLEK